MLLTMPTSQQDNIAEDMWVRKKKTFIKLLYLYFFCYLTQPSINLYVGNSGKIGHF